METLACTTTGQRGIPELHDTKARILGALSRTFDLEIDIKTKCKLLTTKLRKLKQTVQDSGTTEQIDQEGRKVARQLTLYKRLGSEIRCITAFLMNSRMADHLHLCLWLMMALWAQLKDIHASDTYRHNLEMVMAVDAKLQRAEEKLETVRHAVEKERQESSRIQAPYELARRDLQPAPSEQARMSSTTEDDDRDSMVSTWLNTCMAED